MSRTIPFSEAKKHLSAIADEVEKTHDRVQVTRNGRPSFVLISQDELESLEETLDILSEPGALDSILQSRKEHEAGDFARLEDIV